MKRRCIIAGLGIGTGLLLLAYFLVTLDWPVFWDALRNIRTTPLVGSAILIFVSSACRALRWERILRPSIPLKNHPSFLLRAIRCWHALCVGYFGNLVFPARAGEVIRMYQVHKTLDIELGATVAVSVVDRLIDMFCILLIGTILVATVLTDTTSLQSALLPLAVSGIFAICIIIVILIRPEIFRALGQFCLRPFPEKIREKLLQFYDQALFAVRKIDSLRLLIPAVIFSISAFFADIAICATLFAAFGWSLPLKAALAMELSLCVASSLPSAPAYMGLYQAAAVFVLGLFGGTQEDGVAYALVLQILSLLVFATIGGSGFFAFKKKSRADASMAGSAKKTLETP